MGVKVENASSISSNNEAGPEEQSISQLVAKLRTTFRTAVFDEVEETLVSREAKLKREIEKLKGENAVLKEKNQVDGVEKLKVEEQRDFANRRYEELLEELKMGGQCDDQGAVDELKSKIQVLESEKAKLGDLLDFKLMKWESSIPKLEEDIAQLKEEYRKRRCGNCEMIAVNGSRVSSPVIHSDNASDFDGNGGMDSRARRGSSESPLSSKVVGDLQTSGGRKPSDIVIIDSDDDCAPGDTVWHMKAPGKSEEDNYLTRGEKNPRMHKRKRASSLSSHDNDRDNFEEQITPTAEMKQSMKASLDIESSQTLSRAEEKAAGEKSQGFRMSHTEVNDGCANGAGSPSPSSSSGDDFRLEPSYSDAMKILHERKAKKVRQGTMDASS